MKYIFISIIIFNYMILLLIEEGTLHVKNVGPITKLSADINYW